MKKSGFTLAEVLITLMILGVIAALTVPSLIQNTQKREQVVQAKKGLSMINQAITMHYALEQKNLADLESEDDILNMLKQRLAVVNSGDDWVRTQDGLTYYVLTEEVRSDDCGNYLATKIGDIDNTPEGVTAVDGTCAKIVISTLPDAEAEMPDATAELGNLNGYYLFYASSERVIPSLDTQAILNAKDPSAKPAVNAGNNGNG